MERFKEDLTVKFAPKSNPMTRIKLQRFFDHPMASLTKKKKSINTSKIIQFCHKLSLLISNLHFNPIFFFFCDISQKNVGILVLKVSNFKFQVSRRLIKVCIYVKLLLNCHYRIYVLCT